MKRFVNRSEPAVLITTAEGGQVTLRWSTCPRCGCGVWQAGHAAVVLDVDWVHVRGEGTVYCEPHQCRVPA
jgi:hypothetical protein